MSRNFQQTNRSYKSQRSSVASARSSWGNPRNSSYVFGSAAPSLKEDKRSNDRYSRRANASFAAAEPALKESPSRNRETQQKKRSVFQIFSGGARKPQVLARPKTMPFAFKVFACCTFLFAFIGVVNVTLSSAAVVSTQEAEKLSSQITEAREQGKSLEVEYGTLNNPTTLKDKATKLGMATPTEVIQLNITEDNCVLNSDGSIALASSLKAVANQ